MSQHPTRLLDQVRTHLRRQRCSPRPEKANVSWIPFLFHNKRHPVHTGRKEIEGIRHVVVDDHGILIDLATPGDYEQGLSGIK